MILATTVARSACAGSNREARLWITQSDYHPTRYLRDGGTTLRGTFGGDKLVKVPPYEVRLSPKLPPYEVPNINIYNNVRFNGCSFATGKGMCDNRGKVCLQKNW